MDGQGGGAYMAGGAYGQDQGDYGVAGGAYGQGQGDYGMAGGAYGQGQGDYGMAGGDCGMAGGCPGDFGIDGKGQGMMAPGMMDPGMMAPGMMTPGMMAPGMAPGMGAKMTQAERIDEIEKRQIKKLKADTYKQRRKEGRPNHGTTSMACLILASIAILAQTGTLFVPSMRSNYYGVFGYATPRRWGFFGVSGKTTKFWHDIAMDTCGYFGALNVGGVCASPICLWYRLKCESYMTFGCISYGIAFLLVISYFLHIACLAWTGMLTPRSLRHAGKCWPIVLLLNVTGSVAWYIFSENMFDELMARSFYPAPEIGAGLIASGVSSVLLMICTYCGCVLWKMWPDIDLSEWDSSDDEGEQDEDDDKGDSDTDDDSKAKKAKGKTTNNAKAQGGAQAMGMQASVQQGYDMSQGQAAMGMQYMQPQEGGGDAGMGMGAGPVYTPGQEVAWESQPAELRKGATYMPQQPGADLTEQATSAGQA